MKHFFVTSLIILGMIITGCAQRKVVQTPEQQAGQAAESAQKPAAAKDLSKESITEQELGGARKAASQYTAKELASKIQDIHFDFDRYDIRDDAKPALKEISDVLAKNTKAKVVVEGHCDERGTVEYNLALGDRRASSAKAYLVSLGIPSGRIDTVSYGKEKPVCSDNTEECWTRNRRDHFALLEEGK